MLLTLKFQNYVFPVVSTGQHDVGSRTISCLVGQGINAMDSGEQNCAALPSQLTVDDVDVEFLPLIYEIIRRYESYLNDMCIEDRNANYACL